MHLSVKLLHNLHSKPTVAEDFLQYGKCRKWAIHESSVCFMQFLCKYFLPAVVHFHYCRRLTHQAEGFCLVQRASCVFAAMMLVYSFLGCEMHLDSVFVMLLTSASSSWSKTWHHLLQRSVMVQCIRITVMKAFNNNTNIKLEQNENIVIEGGYQGNRTKKKKYFHQSFTHMVHLCQDTWSLTCTRCCLKSRWFSSFF